MHSSTMAAITAPVARPQMAMRRLAIRRRSASSSARAVAAGAGSGCGGVALSTWVDSRLHWCADARVRRRAGGVRAEDSMETAVKSLTILDFGRADIDLGTVMAPG